MPVRAHPGNAHAAREVAIGKTHPRAAEAARVKLLETETRLERHALQRRAHRAAALPQRSRRQPYRAHGSRAAELDGADDRPVAVDASRTARAIEAIECEKLARHEAARRLRGENFRPRRPHGDEQGCDHNRQPRNHTGSPPHYRRRGDCNPPLTIRIRRDFAGCWSTKSEYGYPILTTIRPRTCPSTISRVASMTSASPISFVMAASLSRSSSFARR